ncbi:hypothetical protein KKF61_07070 [Patescibacteria group bacterium]|nr:hypothetical protein [Patescibacteria group bacterium]
MKERERLKERKAITPVISALILSAVVLTVGGVVWAFSQGAMTISAEDYAESVIEMTATISERFIIEHVYYELDAGPDLHMLHVFVYNYGEVDIVVDVYADVDEGESGSSTNYEIPSGAFETAKISLTPSSGKEVAIKVVSRRGNNVYYRYIMP